MRSERRWRERQPRQERNVPPLQNQNRKGRQAKNCCAIQVMSSTGLKTRHYKCVLAKKERAAALLLVGDLGMSGSALADGCFGDEGLLAYAAYRGFSEVEESGRIDRKSVV